MKFKIQGKEYKLDGWYVKHLVETGHLEKYKDGYRWTERSIKKHIKNARRLVRYMGHGWYRFLVKIYRSVSKLVR